MDQINEVTELFQFVSFQFVSFQFVSFQFVSFYKILGSGFHFSEKLGENLFRWGKVSPTLDTTVRNERTNTPTPIIVVLNWREVLNCELGAHLTN
jgi:hypothetical protein